MDNEQFLADVEKRLATLNETVILECFRDLRARAEAAEAHLNNALALIVPDSTRASVALSWITHLNNALALIVPDPDWLMMVAAVNEQGCDACPFRNSVTAEHGHCRHQCSNIGEVARGLVALIRVWYEEEQERSKSDE